MKSAAADPPMRLHRKMSKKLREMVFVDRKVKVRVLADATRISSIHSFRAKFYI